MIPLIFTGARFALTPCVWWALQSCNMFLAACFFASAVATDWLDGLFARLLNQRTQLGAFLDPLADKVLFVTTLAALAYSSCAVSVPLWLFWFIMVREATLVLAAALLRLYDASFVVRPLQSAKYATASLAAFLFYILICPIFGCYTQWVYSLLLAVSLYFLVVSWVLYAYKGYLLWCKKNT